LREGSATVTAIAEPFPTSLNAVSKHLKVLESAGLIRREIVGRRHYCSVTPRRLDEARDWLDYYRAFWTSRLDAMEEELLASGRAQPPPERG
jgi:DNA-binding transcriptional ArsR family regulator